MNRNQCLVRRKLGSTEIEVSKLCFGTLTIGPLQYNLSVDAAAQLFLDAIEAGVNFFDTAELYRTYPHLHKMLIEARREDVVIASKSYAYTYDGMRKSVERALRELGTSYIDIFMLHEQESRLTLKGHEDALRYLVDAKSQGLIRAVGVSTHAVEVVKQAALMPEIDVIHPLLNMMGLGIIDGTRSQMELAVKDAHKAGKGIYLMKALGGGNLLPKFHQAISYVSRLEYVDSIAIGMQSSSELMENLKLLGGDIALDVEDEEVEVERAVVYPRSIGKTIHIEEWCQGCGRCVERCRYHALRLEGGKPVVDRSRCILCGYCASACPGLHIRVY